MINIRAGAVGVAVFLCPIICCSDLIQWSTAVGGNGHYYELIHQDLSWMEAHQLAQNSGGYLATVTSLAENQWITETFNESSLHHVWLGGYQDFDATAIDSSWHWVTDEPWSYANWGGYLDDNGPELTAGVEDGGENYLEMFLAQTAYHFDNPVGVWSDIQATHPNSVLLVEYDVIPEPSSPLFILFAAICVYQIHISKRVRA